LTGRIQSFRPRHKLVIGSFLIVTLIGFLSMKALGDSDRLIYWAPPESDFYLHLKIERSETIWQQVSALEPFAANELTLGAIVPPDTKEIAVMITNEKCGILLKTERAPAPIEEMAVTRLENDLYLIKEQNFPEVNKNESYAIAVEKTFKVEPIDAAGYLYVRGNYLSGLLPEFAANQTEIENAAAWSLYEKKGAVIWENSSPRLFAEHRDLLSNRLPQNTVYWTHGTNWQTAIEESLARLPEAEDRLVAASGKLEREMENANTPSHSFKPLFSYPYDLIITRGENNETAYVLKIQKTANDYHIWLKNFEKYWLSKIKETLPLYTTVTLPDGSRAVEMTADEALSWEEQNIANNIVHWLKGRDNEFMIGYYDSADAIYFSNNYSNLVDFLYSDSQKGWIEIEKEAEKCGFSNNEIGSYRAHKNNFTKISQIINIFGPYLINTNGDICHI